MSSTKPTRVRKEPERLTVGEPKIKKARASGTTKKSTKKGKDGPKRFRSAFLYFSAEHRAAVKAANPDATFGELGKLLAAKWKQTSDTKKYDDLAKKDKARFEKEKKAAGKE